MRQCARYAEPLKVIVHNLGKAELSFAHAHTPPWFNRQRNRNRLIAHPSKDLLIRPLIRLSPSAIKRGNGDVGGCSGRTREVQDDPVEIVEFGLDLQRGEEFEKAIEKRNS